MNKIITAIAQRLENDSEFPGMHKTKPWKMLRTLASGLLSKMMKWFTGGTDNPWCDRFSRHLIGAEKKQKSYLIWWVSQSSEVNHPKWSKPSLWKPSGLRPGGMLEVTTRGIWKVRQVVVVGVINREYYVVGWFHKTGGPDDLNWEPLEEVREMWRRYGLQISLSSDFSYGRRAWARSRYYHHSIDLDALFGSKTEAGWFSVFRRQEFPCITFDHEMEFEPTVQKKQIDQLEEAKILDVEKDTDKICYLLHPEFIPTWSIIFCTH